MDEEWDQDSLFDDRDDRGAYEDHDVVEAAYVDASYSYESRRRKTDRPRRERRQRDEDDVGDGVHTVFLKESRDGSPGQLLDAAEYRRLRELER